MANTLRALMMIAIFTILASVTAGDTGLATYYTTYVPSACYGYTDEGTMIAAASPAIYNNGAACGRMYQVTCTGAANGGGYPCTGASVTVKVVDLCPGCQGAFDLSQQAFAAIANLDAGVIQIEYDQV
ncbi:hypothetical protein Nepgr_015634 [Nepenthes gracilis]|uniref:Expansin-like EG45 domain-containing protein n=1 Tax=Nepenthes gracilis TaxID=150966 RepID=A0AAD3SM37_NEPGR|nr:hypothetical protein Nepgr_015634 [Nepenthes gracilis]